MMDLTQALLALVSTLVGFGFFTVKSLLARSDKLIEQRDKHIEKALQTLGEAVSSFRGFEASEEATHSAILEGLHGITSALDKLANKIERMDGHIQEQR